jgi:hypothetical protein
MLSQHGSPLREDDVLIAVAWPMACDNDFGINIDKKLIGKIFLQLLV